jgi:hypothetical protein
MPLSLYIYICFDHLGCRKGIASVILERSESLRATGGGIAVHTNGWRALEQLGIASELRQTALTLQLYALFLSLPPPLLSR